MRLRAIYAFATAPALLLFGACGSNFSALSNMASGGAGASGAGGHEPLAGSGSSGVAGAAVAGAGDVSSAGAAGGPEGGSGGAACSNPVTDCPATGSTCAQAVCVAQSHACRVTNAALGSACKDHGGTVCNGEGSCVSTHCADGVQDADETDVDCGGSCGATCKDSAPQQKCKVAGDCASGDCSGSTLLCQPPPTCASTCGSCQSCAIPGQVGTCSALPPGADDAGNFCFMMAVCDGSGVCTGALNKGHFGDACSENSGCFNGTCAAGVCRLRNGDACGEDGACKSARCSANVCAACVVDSDCASGQCNAGTCLLPGGYPCATANDCLSGQCFGKACAPSGNDPCLAQTCVTHFCQGGICKTCSSTSDCPLGTACTGGACLLPAGAYCTSNASCASGTCGPTTLLSLRRCQ